MNRSQIRLRAMATVCAGSLALGLTACGEPEVPATEHLSASKHLSWAGEELLPKWAAADDVLFTPFGDLPEAATELPDGFVFDQVGEDNLTIPDHAPFIPGKAMLFSKQHGAALDPGTGMVYRVNPLIAELEGGEQETSAWVPVMKDGAPKAIALFEWDEAAKGLQASSAGVRIAQIDLRSGNVEHEAEVDSLIVQESNFRFEGTDGDRAYFSVANTDSRGASVDFVAVDVATGEEVAYEKIDGVLADYDGVQYFPVFTSEGLLAYYTTRDDELRVKNLSTGADDSIRGDLKYVAVFPFQDRAFALGIDPGEVERCEDDRDAETCKYTMLTLNGAEVSHEVPFQSSRSFSRGYAPFVVGDIVTINQDGGSGITVVNAATGTELFALSGGDQRELNIRNAISDGESLFTSSHSGGVTQNSIETRQLIDDNPQVYPVNSPSGARIWKVLDEETASYDVLVAKEDLGKF